MTIATCPLVPWYELQTCSITTCKNFTQETAHKCLELDRKKPEGTKQFSDAELNLYKFRQRSISTRLVQIHRKTAIQNVKSILILKKFIVWIDENFKSGAKFDYEDMLRLEKEYPLKIKRLGWKNWMWEYVLDESVWTRFAAKTDGECAEFNVYQLLNVKIGRFEGLQRNLKSKSKGITNDKQNEVSDCIASRAI